MIFPKEKVEAKIIEIEIQAKILGKKETIFQLRVGKAFGELNLDLFILL
jgi:hypothetical protein